MTLVRIILVYKESELARKEMIPSGFSIWQSIKIEKGKNEIERPNKWTVVYNKYGKIKSEISTNIYAFFLLFMITLDFMRNRED